MKSCEDLDIVQLASGSNTYALLNFLTSNELPKTAVSLITQPSAASAGVSISEFVMPYNNPAATEIVTTLYIMKEY